MIVKMTKNLENKMEKMQESINKDLGELKNKHTETNNTITEIKSTLSSVQFSSVAQSCLTLCDPRDGSPPGSSVPGILFFFWDPCNSNVGAFDIVSEVSETVLSSFYSFNFILFFRSYFHHFIFQLTD